jgi:hypothetical protein
MGVQNPTSGSGGLTASDVLESDRDVITAETATLTKKSGRHLVIADRDSTTQTITLPDPTSYSTAEDKEAYIEIENIGTVMPDYVVDGGSNILLTGDATGVATYSAPARFAVTVFRLVEATNWAVMTHSI